MAKETGLGWTTLSVDDSTGSPNDIRDNITNCDFATPRGVLDVTSIAVSAYERLLGLADFTVNLSMSFDDAASKMHVTFRTVPSTSVARTTSIGVSGQTLAAEVLYTDYALTRGNDGGFTATAPGVLAGGVVPTWA